MNYCTAQGYAARTWSSRRRHRWRGIVTYEVVKHRGSGRVEFVATCHSQPSPWLDPVLRLGWALFGRRTQLRFYRRCGERLRALVQASLAGQPTPSAEPERLGTGDLVLAPTGTTPHPLDRITLRRHHPAR